jgi:hypothetical protein
MTKKSVQFNFEIKTDPHSSYTPVEFKLNGSSSKFNKSTTQPALKYFNDALVTMNYQILSHFKNSNDQDKKFINTYVQNIDPYFELFQNSLFRLKNLIKPEAFAKKQTVQKFETELSVQIDSFFKNETVHFNEFNALLKFNLQL